MSFIVESLSINQDWLLTANLLLSSLLLLWVVRYRVLYRKSNNVAHMHSASIEGLGVGFYRATLDGKIIAANPALVRMHRMENESQLLKWINDEATKCYVDPHRSTEFRDVLLNEGKVTDFVSQIFNQKNGETAWITESAHLVAADDNTKPTHYEGSVQDITDTVNRSKLEERLEKLAENLPGGLFQLTRNVEGNYIVAYASDGFRKMMNFVDADVNSPEKYLGNIKAEYRDGYIATLEQSYDRLSNWTYEFKMNTGNGIERWFGLSATPQKLRCGAVTWHGHINDISERKMAEGKIAYYAYYDTLTGLPNRTCFMHQLERTVVGAKRKGEHWAVLFIDLDNFKNLNDSEGHATGDELLKAVARRLENCVRANDMVSRFGGDEFVILLDAVGENHAAARENATVVAYKIISAFAAGFEIGANTYRSSPSIGIVPFDGAITDAQLLLKNADIAMYQAKKDGRNNFKLFDGNLVPPLAPSTSDLELDTQAQERRSLATPSLEPDDNKASFH